MKQGQFIKLMSESLGVEEKSIRLIVRTLREAGLFTTGPRGVNAPDMTHLDAARVVIAVLASYSPSRAVRDVEYFGNLKPDCRAEWSDATKIVGIDPEQTLERVLTGCIANELAYEKIVGGYVKLSEDGKAEVHFAEQLQGFHQREQWQAIMAESDGSNDHPNPDGWENWETLQRLRQTKINRSAEFPLEELHQIGVEMNDDTRKV